MLYMLIFIIFLICIIIFKHPHNNYSIIISMEFFSVTIFLSAIILVCLILNNFSHTSTFEHIIYRFTSTLSFNYFDISTLFNISASIFLIASFSLTAMDNLVSVKKHSFVPIAVYAAFTLICFLILNSSGFIESIYIKQMENRPSAIYLRFTVSAAVNTATVVGIAFPMIKIIKQIHITKFYTKQRFLILTLALQTLLDVFFLICINMTPLVNFYVNFDLYNFNTSYVSAFLHMEIWQLVVMLILVVATLILSINFNEKAFYPKRHLSSRTSVVAQDMRSIFHSYKNMLFMTNILTDKAIGNYGTDDGLSALFSIKQKNNIFLQKINHFLDIYNKPSLNYQTADILQCVSRALDSSSIPESVTPQIINNSYDSSFFGDTFLIEEVLINLLNNASDAIKQKDCKEGIIRIEIWNEYKWLCLSVRDNGNGISRKNRRKIFKPFFSTKKSLTGWGVGLSYSRNIIIAHGGYICFKSKPGSFTEFQISLPVENI